MPLDLHMEHLNATLKNSIAALGANKTEESILHLGRCIGQLQTLLANFDDQHNVSQGCGKHSQKSFKTDLSKVVEMVKSKRVFMYVAGCKNQEVSITSPLSWNLKSDFVEWMKINIHRSFYPPSYYYYAIIFFLDIHYGHKNFYIHHSIGTAFVNVNLSH